MPNIGSSNEFDVELKQIKNNRSNSYMILNCDCTIEHLYVIHRAENES